MKKKKKKYRSNHIYIILNAKIFSLSYYIKFILNNAKHFFYKTAASCARLIVCIFVFMCVCLYAHVYLQACVYAYMSVCFPLYMAALTRCITFKSTLQNMCRDGMSRNDFNVLKASYNEFRRTLVHSIPSSDNASLICDFLHLLCDLK